MHALSVSVVSPDARVPHACDQVSWRHMKDQRKKREDQSSMVSGKSEKYNSAGTESYGSEPNFGAPPPNFGRQETSGFGLHSENI